MFVGVTDSAERMMDLERNPPQRAACEHDRAIGEIAPIAVVQIVQLRRMVENQTDAFEGNEAIGELVLDRLEFSNRLAELVTLLHVVGHQLESPSGGAMRTRRQRQLALEQEIVEKAIIQRNKSDWRRIQPDLIKTP